MVSLAVSLATGEMILRYKAHYPLTGELPYDLIRFDEIKPRVFEYAKSLPLPEDVDFEWFRQSPSKQHYPDLPLEIKQLYYKYDHNLNVIRLYNINYLYNHICVHHNTTIISFFQRILPTGYAYCFVPPNKSKRPSFRYYPNSHLPDTSLNSEFNNYGWRGPPVPLNKPDSVVRIAFVGASTTIQSHGFQFSFPELVEYWLNVWAKKNNVPVNFEVINTGREGLGIQDLSAVVKYELLPVKPDMVVYHEGINQFDLRSNLNRAYADQYSQPQQLGINRITHYSALARRILQNMGGLVSEPGKPDYQLRLPEDVNMSDPKITNPNLPASLPTIIHNLDSMRHDLDSIGSELAISSFTMLVYDGMKLNPVAHPFIYKFWNEGYWPFTYKDLAYFADFQNRVLEKYAKNYDLAFIDIDQGMPQDPDLFTDGVHLQEPTVRLKAWSTFIHLLPVVKQKIESGRWPKQRTELLEGHPYFKHSKFYKVYLECNCPPRKKQEDKYCLNHFYE